MICGVLTIPVSVILRKDGDSVRKFLLLVLVLLLALLCAFAYADTEYDLGGISGKITFSDDQYVVLTRDNLADHPDLLASIGKTQETLLADWEERQVLLQAWSKGDKNSTSVEITVSQDETAARYYDLNARTGSDRRQYYNETLTKYREQGYVIDNEHCELKKHSKSGYYVTFQYVNRTVEPARRGILRQTIRNGYTLCMNYEVYERKVSRSDEDKSRKLVNLIEIEDVEPTASSGTVTTTTVTDPETGIATETAAVTGAAATLDVTVPPPAETNSGVFTVEGKAYPGARLIIVAMRWVGSSTKFTADATKAGNFKAKVTLPEEGLYQFSINMEIDGEIVADSILNAVTFSRTLLPVTMDQDPPEKLTGDELVISGVTDKGVTVQCIVTNGVTTYDKMIKTNGTGVFKFPVKTDIEAEYNITLAFSKKGLNTRRLTYKCYRNMTEEDNKNHAVKDAIKPAYAALVKNLDTYIGRIMVYDVYIVSIEQKGDEWIIQAAQKQNKNGSYDNLLYYMAKEEPGFSLGSRIKIYGTCIGAFQVQSEEGNESYPGFDYLFIE